LKHTPHIKEPLPQENLSTTEEAIDSIKNMSRNCTFDAANLLPFMVAPVGIHRY
jgi:hypothetical protein